MTGLPKINLVAVMRDFAGMGKRYRFAPSVPPETCAAVADEIERLTTALEASRNAALREAAEAVDRKADFATTLTRDGLRFAAQTIRSLITDTPTIEESSKVASPPADPSNTR